MIVRRDMAHIVYHPSDNVSIIRGRVTVQVIGRSNDARWPAHTTATMLMRSAQALRLCWRHITTESSHVAERLPSARRVSLRCFHQIAGGCRTHSAAWFVGFAPSRVVPARLQPYTASRPAGMCSAHRHERPGDDTPGAASCSPRTDRCGGRGQAPAPGEVDHGRPWRCDEPVGIDMATVAAVTAAGASSVAASATCPAGTGKLSPRQTWLRHRPTRPHLDRADPRSHGDDTCQPGDGRRDGGNCPPRRRGRPSCNVPTLP